jgi:RNA-directed DNA polymerase
MQVGSKLTLLDVCSNLGLMPDIVLDVSQHSAHYYTKFERPKRNGGTRVISASQGRLKLLQRTFLDGMLASFPMPPHVHGCVKGRSQITNARLHVDQDVLINIDLSDFFGSVSFDTVNQILVDKFRFDDEAAEVFSRLCISGGTLPQGAPTSPILANIAALPLDDSLIDICKRTVPNFQYSRYVDDITISGGIQLSELIPTFYKAIEENGFRPNVQKTRILRRSIRQSVTGVVVNKKVTVPKTVLRDIRQQFYYCDRFGIREHCETHGLTPEQFLKGMRAKISYIRPALPDLATEFAVKLSGVAKRLAQTHEERYLALLKRMIDNDEVASFYYPTRDGSYNFAEKPHRAAPAAIIIDPTKQLVVRAFQLQPEQGWRYFLISQMRSLKAVSPALKADV